LSFILNLSSFFVGISSADLDIKLVGVLEGENEGDRFGVAVAVAGDVNGDGYDDVLVGIVCASTCSGKAYLYLGGETFDREPSLSFDGEEDGSAFGRSVVSVGDVNGDFFDDFIISAPGFNDDCGKVYLYHGGSTTDSIPDLAFFVGEEEGRLQVRCCSPGDVNGDGFDDIILSAPRIVSLFGEIYLYLGGAMMDTIPDMVISANERFFGVAASLAEVNGDGYDDIVTLSSDSLVYVFLGGESLDAEVDLTLAPPQGRYLNDLATGDINGDGFEDIIVSNVFPESTNVYVYYGGSPMDTVIDVVISDYGDEIATGYINNDKYADILIGDESAFYWWGAVSVFLGGEAMDTIPDYGVIGEQLGEFGLAVASGGDLNGDGVEDFIVGQPMYPHRIETGKAFVFAGDPSPTAVDEFNSEGQTGPKEIHLFQNYPNPFNQGTDIRYQIPDMGLSVHTTLRIYNALGQEIVTLVDETREPGYHSVTWDASDLSSGVYFCRLTVGEFTATRNMVLMK